MRGNKHISVSLISTSDGQQQSQSTRLRYDFKVICVFFLKTAAIKILAIILRNYIIPLPYENISFK